jgi:two-component system, LytTR family, response regulator
MTPRDERVRTLIVDDEPLARKRLRALLADEPDIEIIGEAGSGTAAVQAIATGQPDLVFLDIQMPGLDGFDVLRATAGVHQPFVVFVTAHDEHALKAFEVEAVDYVLKPVVEARLRAAVRRAVSRLREGSPKDFARDIAHLLERVAPAAERVNRIPIKRDGRTTFVRVADIDWVDADRDFLRLHAGKETHIVRDTMTEMEGKLPADTFMRIHRSIIVNLERVREVQPWFKGDYVLILHDGTKLRSGRTYRDSVQRLLK